MDRTAYNKAHYAIQKKRSDELKRFQELYPERYIELLAKVQREIEKVGPYVKVNLPCITVSRSLTTEELDNIAYKPNERHVFVHAKDSYGGEHLYCESVIFPNPNIEQAITVAIQRHCKAVMTSYELCHCPACVKRHPNN